MKTLKSFFAFVLVLGAINVHAQNTYKTDSAYYLLDTAHIPASDRLWSTYSEGMVKFYTLKMYGLCSSLLNEPTFAYNTVRRKAKKISKDELKALRLSSLSELMHTLTKFAEEDGNLQNSSKRPFYLYIIEYHNGYNIVKTQLDGSGPKVIVN